MTRFACLTSAFLVLAGCSSGIAQTCDSARIGFAGSSLGFDYKSTLASPLAEIVSQGEVERLAAASIAPGEVSARDFPILRGEWQELITRLFSNTLPDQFDGGSVQSMDFLRDVTPVMLARLKKCGPAADPRLAYLADVRLEPTAGVLE